MALLFADPVAPISTAPPAPVPGPVYEPGVCNIGPAEIARRRRGAWAATIVTLVLAIAVFALGWPPPARVVIALPAAAAIVSWLQVVLHFCVGFARLGVFNFGAVGPMERVVDPAARRADQRRAASMIVVALVGGLAIGLTAALLP
ncbi:MAG: hypothetical protein ACHQZR_00205 [Candidatus Limnocylindrales bacterium]